jgi:hypothetical protein
MKKLVTIALMGAFLAAANVGCESKKEPVRTAEPGKDGPSSRVPPK